MAARKAVVLLSGGLDSATMLAIAGSKGFETHALTARYGQRHAVEVDAAKKIAEQIGVSGHRFMDIDLRQFGASALTSDLDVPVDRTNDEMNAEIPVTYVPARNTIFLSFALAWAEVLEAFDIFIGVNALDYSGYPDCRPEYIAAFETMASLATKSATESTRSMTIHTPLINLTKAEIIRRGVELGVDYELTVTCYAPSDVGVACGRCDACRLRLQGFAIAGIADPARYQSFGNAG